MSNATATAAAAAFCFSFFFFYSINRMGIPFSRLGFLFCFITGQQEPLGIPIETKLFLLFPFFFVCVKI